VSQPCAIMQLRVARQARTPVMPVSVPALEGTSPHSLPLSVGTRSSSEPAGVSAGQSCPVASSGLACSAGVCA
jgi:hypothetical protein